MTQEDSAWAVVQGLADPELAARFNFFTEIASLLVAGGPWAPVPETLAARNENVKFVAADGKSIYFNHYKDRYTIRGYDWPRDKRGTHHGTQYNEVVPDISVSENRTPKQIAGEIERRLLPDYLRIWTRGVESARQSDEYYSKLTARTDRLADLTRACGSTVLDYRGERLRDGQINYAHRESGYVSSLEVHSDDVSIELRVSDIETAAQIIRLVYGK